MSFGDAIRSAYGNYARFAGRASRSEYWWYQLFVVLVTVAWALASAASGHTYSLGAILGLALLAFWIGSLVPSLALLCRRLHDSGHSGWWAWIALVPYIGALILLVFTLLPSSPSYNSFGAPAGQPAADAFAEYHGWTRADALAQFSNDAQRAAASGYQPVHQEWQRRGNGEVLIVAYSRNGGQYGWPQSPGYHVPPWQNPNGGLN